MMTIQAFSSISDHVPFPNFGTKIVANMEIGLFFARELSKIENNLPRKAPEQGNELCV